MKHYSKYINPYMEKILNNEIEHCKEQEDMINNIVIPVLERDDVYIDEKKIEEGLSLQKYFPYKLIEWEVFLFALIVGVFKTDGDIFFKEVRIVVGRGSGKNGFISFLSLFINHNFVWGDVPILRWFTNNTKKIIQNGNVSYGKIEPNYRKTDGFMALVNAVILAQELKEKKKANPKAFKVLVFNN